ncbi:V-type ATPase 116kDa subunit family protein [Arthrobacter sp. AL08]|uniref:V-type ATPase 116kDa subunit family protein n=1 Tax=unclassified Arthrobacter TaxID=235627 RepID=UPI00249C41EA|nr:MULTISPECIES: V-type ATPase 116kDa subunit family protein [unclassified Arthrobacter]MDI3242318.1 V-type ATPase 116kDa subunit family protein [Arthrobacter sp. AL05]MDI3278328.1 V-type ATPase 116kDa subunit family protein [Arthrobacter sp. AL08]
MRQRESLAPVRMERVALVVPEQNRRQMLVDLAASAVVELDLPYTPGNDAEELDKAAAAFIASGPSAALVGWTPRREIPALEATLAPLGAAVVPLPRPRWTQPPTMLAGGDRSRVSRTLVDTYGTVPYADLDPSRLAGIAYVLMFGMMFGDVGHGAVLLAVGLLLRSGRIKKLAKLQRTWLFVTGAGLAAMVFGALYGEAFGPTGLIPVLWLEPLANPVPLLVAGLGVGAFLLAGAYAIGTINRVREGGWGYALYSRSGIAGSLLFVAVGLLVWGVGTGTGILTAAAVVVSLAALVFIFIGLFVEAGGGATAGFQAVIELVDTVIRLGSNLVSFARLAAFGLTHAALLMVVWNGTTALWAPDWRAAAAIVLFIVGNAVTFALEALVAGIQALRLEYYELFSRIFQSEGRPFTPWSPELTAASGPGDDSSSAPSGIPAERQLL